MKRSGVLFSLLSVLCAASLVGGGTAQADDKAKILKQADDSIRWDAPAAPSAVSPAAASSGYARSDEDLQRMWDDMDRMHQALMQRAMSDGWGLRSRMRMPSAMDLSGGSAIHSDIAETDKELVITCDLPGVSKDSVKISVEGNLLIVQAVRDAGTDKSGEENGQKYQFRERSYGSVTRSFHIGSGVDPKEIKASYKDGVLTLRVPKGQSQAVTVPIQETEETKE